MAYHFYVTVSLLPGTIGSALPKGHRFALVTMASRRVLLQSNSMGVLSTAGTEASDSSLEDRRTSSSASRARHRKSENILRGRLLAPHRSGFVPSKEPMCLKLIPTPRPRWLSKRINIVVAKHGEVIGGYAKNSRIYMTRGGFVIRNDRKEAIVKACFEQNKAIVYGTRPFFAGAKASHREGATKFFPWLVVRVNQDETFTFELFGRKQLSLWYSEKSIRCKAIDIMNFLDNSVVCTLCLDENDSTVLLSSGADPAVMISFALILAEFQKRLQVEFS